MTYYHIHFLNARSLLTRVMPELRALAGQTVALAGEHIRVPNFDMVVRAGKGIPEWGVAGAAPAPGLIELTLDPTRFNPALTARTLMHEIHHLLRWDGPGYGRSLGEALVSEGLAGHFVLQTLGDRPDPWDSTPPTQAVTKRAVTEWARLDYDHSEWFFGKGGLRRWAGYGLGHRLIADYLDQHIDETAASLAHISAETLRPTLRRMTPDADTDTNAARSNEEDA